MQNVILPTTMSETVSENEKKRKFEQISKKNDESDDEVEFVKEVVPPTKKPRTEALTQLQTQQKPKEKESEDEGDEDDKSLIQKINKERDGEIWEVSCHMTWYSRKKEEKEDDEHIAYVASKREALLYAIKYYEKYDENGLKKLADMTTEQLEKRLNGHDIVEDDDLGHVYSGTRSYGIEKVGKIQCLSNQELLKDLREDL